MPLKFNDGQTVPAELVQMTKHDLLQRFDGLTLSPQVVTGMWKHVGATYEDELLRFVIDVEDSDENQFFFSNLKTVLLERFQQIEIYIVSFPIDRL